MAKKAKAAKSASADVKSYKHKEAKRKNIPTAENQKLIADDDKAVKKLRWPRNPGLDPQLVWRDKDSDPIRWPSNSSTIFDVLELSRRSNMTSKSAERYPANAVETPIFT